MGPTTNYIRPGYAETNAENSACPFRSGRKSTAHHYKISLDGQGNPKSCVGYLGNPHVSTLRFPRHRQEPSRPMGTTLGTTSHSVDDENSLILDCILDQLDRIPKTPNGSSHVVRMFRKLD